jgi:hypothetical protein
MNWIFNQIKNKLMLLTVITSTALLISCGGGEDGTSEVSSLMDKENLETEVVMLNVLKNDYKPDSTKLTITAKSSDELYVEPSFNFNNHKKVFFNVSATDAEGDPMVNKLLLISSINNEITTHDDPRLQDKSLLAMTKTNINGQAYLTLEIPQKVANILLELNAIGIENDVILPISSSGEISYQFKPIR